MTVHQCFAMKFNHATGIIHTNPNRGPLSDKSDPPSMQGRCDSGFVPPRIRTNPLAYSFPRNKSASVIVPPGTITRSRDCSYPGICSYPVSCPFPCTQRMEFCFISIKKTIRTHWNARDSGFVINKRSNKLHEDPAGGCHDATFKFLGFRLSHG